MIRSYLYAAAIAAVLALAGADSMPGPKLVRRRAYWHLLSAWMGWSQ